MLKTRSWTIQGNSIYQENDSYKTNKSRTHILALIYVFKSFLPIKAHQAYEKGFIVYLETIAFEKH